MPNENLIFSFFPGKKAEKGKQSVQGWKKNKVNNHKSSAFILHLSPKTYYTQTQEDPI